MESGNPPPVLGAHNLRQPEIFNGQLYVSTSSGSAVRVGTVGLAADTYRGLAVSVSGSTVTLYSTRKGGGGAAGGGELVSITDGSGYNGAFSGIPTLLATPRPRRPSRRC